jgi:phosphomannomutase
MLQDEVLIGGEESGGMSIHGHIPEGDGILMGLLLLEMVAGWGAALEELVEQLLAEVGPSHYSRLDLRLASPVSKQLIADRLRDGAPSSIGSLRVHHISDQDGIKYVMDDDSWLLIRPSGTEPVLRVYAEAREPQALEELISHGRQVAQAG